LDAQRVLNHVLTEIDKLRQDQESFLNAGRAGDFPEYRHICGIIRGLGHAEQLVSNLVQKLESYEDE